MLCKVIYQMQSLYSKDHSGQKIQFCNVHNPNVTQKHWGNPTVLENNFSSLDNRKEEIFKC